MIREQINKFIKEAVGKLAEGGFLGLEGGEIISKNDSVSVCKDRAHGDYASNVAMQLARVAKKNPMEIAEKIKEELEKSIKVKKIFFKIEVAAPGFINFSLNENYLKTETAKILKLGKDYGRVNIGKGKKTQVEFISANPSGQLHIGNGRSGFYGDVLGNVLGLAGYNVEKEYYINDAKVSRQIQTLGATALGRGEAYLSPYLKEKIAKLQPRLLKYRSETEAGFFLGKEVLKDLKKFITAKLKIKFDRWQSEDRLFRDNWVSSTYELLKDKKLVFEKDDAYWLDLSAFGQKDEVLLRGDGSPSYFLADIGYHRQKIERGYKKIIDIWGADHQGHVPRMKAVMKIFGYKGEFDVLITQLVRLKSGRMSKRAGNIITVDWLVDEVGVDAARFFYLQSGLQSQMEFDVALAKQRSSDSSVFYAQYAHARIASILCKAKLQGSNPYNFAGVGPLRALEHFSEMELMKKLLQFPEIVVDTAKDYQLQRICLYAVDLAVEFNKFYHDCQVLCDDKKIAQGRLALAVATKITLGNVFAILGISAPEKM